jgi:hypothetical protein
MLIPFVLICVTSFVLRSPISLNIYNGCLHTNLMSPAYFIHGGKWDILPDKRVDIIHIMRSRLEFDPGQDVLEGALVYEIRRKLIESGEFIQNESKSIHLLVAWHIDHTKGSAVYALLVEHDKEFNWDEDKLRRLYQKYWHPLGAWSKFIGNNWLLNDATVLRAAVDIMNGGYKLDIIISERNEVVIERPLWVDAERWVPVILAIFLILMCVVSLTLHMPMDVTVYNQCSGIELTSPICFYDAKTYNGYCIERMGDGAVMKISFRFGLLDKFPGGALIYEVQRKGNTESDHQSSTDTVSTTSVEDTSKVMRFLVTWEIKSPGRSRTRMLLIEHDNALILNEAKLAQLYNKVNDIPSGVYNWILKYDGIYKSTWLMYDNTVLEATDEIIYEKGLELKINLSEGVKDKHAGSAFWIDSTRQVLSLTAIYSMLIYITSLALRSSMNVTIDNQCSNIELTSPVYFTKNTMHHIQLHQQVDSKSIMKVKFKTGMDQDTFGGVLLYHLQRKVDTSISTQLLMIWGFKSDHLYSCAWLIEHERTFTWNEDKLRRLYDVYNSQYDRDFNAEEWLLDDNAMLKTVCALSHGGFEMNIFISEEKDLSYHRKPLWVDPSR